MNAAVAKDVVAVAKDVVQDAVDEGVVWDTQEVGEHVKADALFLYCQERRKKGSEKQRGVYYNPSAKRLLEWRRYEVERDLRKKKQRGLAEWKRW